MGQEIVYCFGCQTRLMSADFDAGKAFRFEDRVTCAACTKGYLASLPPDKRPKPLTRKSDPAIPVVTPRRGVRLPAGSTPRPDTLPAVQRKSRGSPRALILAGVGGMVVILIILIVLLSGGSEEPQADVQPPPPPPPSSLPKIEAPEVDPRHAAARQALARAENLPESAPLEERIRAFDEVVKLASGTPAHARAREAYDALIAQRRKAQDLVFEKLADQVRPLLAKEQYQQARDRFRAALARYALPEWTSRLERKIRGLDDEVDRLYQPLKQQAGEAKARGDVEAVKKVRDRLAAWGMKRLITDLDGFLETVRMPEPESPQLLAYRKAWKNALPRFAAREYAAALADLRAAAKNITEEELRKQARADLKDLGRLEALLAEALKLAVKLPPGETVRLEVRDGKGERRTVSGVVAKAGPARLRIVDPGGKGTYVELEDLTAAAVAGIAAKVRKDLPGDDRRVLALACLIEGNQAAARAVLKGSSERVPVKYRDYASGAKVKFPAVEPREIEARALFYGAERGFESVETQIEAVEKYVELRDTYADTRLVAGALARIKERADTGKEYFLTAHELVGSGTFSRAKQEDGNVWWLNAREGRRSLENNVAFEFAAMPGRVYRCWVYAGACCAETFAVEVQATGMTGPDPAKRTRKVAIDPGSDHAASVRHRVRYLKRRHQDHGGPKHPTRWAWIPLKLPTEPAPGPFEIRLVSNQKGFAVAAACISAERTAPPSEKETRAELAREKERPDPEIVTEGLVGHWKFDDGSGDTALDSVNPAQTGQLQGGPQWVKGVHGGALKFDGVDDHVILPSAPTLNDLQEGNYTIAAWFNAEDTPPGTGDANDAGYGIIIKEGNHTGLEYNCSRQFIMHHWLAEGQRLAGTWNDTYAHGSFTHVAGVVDRDSGKTHIYVNAKCVATRSWDEAGAAAREYGDMTWRIGIGAPGASQWGWAAKGLIDDVRFYNRAVTPEELKVLYAAGLEAQSRD